MNRRDYELIAHCLKISNASDSIISLFCAEIKKENHTFNEKKFIERIKGKENKCLISLYCFHPLNWDRWR